MLHTFRLFPVPSAAMISSEPVNVIIIAIIIPINVIIDICYCENDF